MMLGGSSGHSMSHISLEEAFKVAKNPEAYRADTERREKANAALHAENAERKRLLAKIDERLAQADRRHAEANKRDADHVENVTAVNNRFSIVAMRERQLDEAEAEITKLKADTAKDRQLAASELAAAQRERAQAEALRTMVQAQKQAADARDAKHRAFVAEFARE